MRKLYAFLCFLVAMMVSLGSYAQEVVTLTFDAEHQDHSYQKLDSIHVTNLTKGWSEVLYYPDTVLTMNTVGIPNWESDKGNVKLYQNVPNPFNGITDFKLTLYNKEKVDLVVFDINGKKVAEYHNSLPSGEHQFRATLNTPQTYLLSAVTKNGTTSIKMINLSNTGEQARIEYISSLPLTVDMAKKHTNNLFSQGDNMQYVGYATQIDGVKEATITQKQQGSGPVTFVFPNEEIPPYLTVRTDSAYNLTSTTATLSGSWKAHNMTVTEEGFNWKQAGAAEWNTLTCDHTDAEFTFGIRNLTKETQYVFKAYAIAEEEYYYGEEVTFTTTGIVPPTVTTDSVTDIDFNRAHVYGSFTKGEESVKKIGFELREGAEWVNIRSFIGTQITSPFNYEMFDLQQNTKYAVRAYAITESDTTYAEPKYFTTAAITPPIVKTLEATEIASVKALLHGTFTKTSEEVTACGFQYKKDSTDSWLAVAATLTPEFSALATSLMPSTKYIFRAYAQTASDIVYGEELSFTTGEYVMPSIEAGEVTDVTNNSATVSAKQSNGAEVIERGFIYSLYPGVTLNSNATYQIIKTIKDASTEDGIFSTTLSLVQGAIYYVRGYAKTSDFTLYTEDMKVVMPDPEGLVDCGTMVDADGNEYRTVRLGSNCWARTNLHTTKLSDGTPIEMFVVNRETNNKLSQTGVYYVPVVYSSDTFPKEVCGYFYNYGAALSEVSPCPVGWRVATFDDYMDLFAYIQTIYNVSGTLNTNKSTGSIGVNVAPYMCLPHYWNGRPLQNSTNETGFNYFYAGDIDWSVSSGGYSYYRFQGRYDALLTSTKASGNSPWFMQSTGNTTWQKYYNTSASYGQFIRCVKEPEPELGVVKTEAMSDVTYYSATAHGKIVSNGHTVVTERGFCWNTDTAPTVDNHKVPVEGAEVNFSTVLNDLTHETTYYVKAYMINSVGISYGEEVSFKTLPLPVVPTVTTGEARNIMKDQATVDGEVTSDGGEAVTARGICYATTPEPTIESNVIPSGEGLGSFSVEIKELVSGQTYYARAYATNKVGTAYGNEVTFAPLIEAKKPTVVTLSVENILDTKATVNSEVTENGGADVTERGICYSTTNDQPDLNDKSIKAKDAGMGTYTIQMDSLSFETTYYVRAYAVNEAGVGYGDALTFTTLEEIKEIQVRAGEVTGVTRTEATVSATLLYGVDVTERGFIYSLYPGRKLTSHATYQLLGTIKDESTENGEFTHTFTNLIQGGTYYVRGYAKTADKEVYSEDMKVVMQDPEGLVDCGTMIDGEGNEYRTAVIGGNCWIRENLRTTKYADGTPITMFDRPTMTMISTEEAQYEPFIQSGDTMPAEVCGYYYGVGFVNDEKSVCPAGWRVSTMDDWCALFNYVSETYADNTAVTCNTSGRGSIGAIALAYPIILPHYFASFNIGKPQTTSNATGFGWFYAGSLNGNTGSSYPRCEGKYDAYWTSTKTGSNCLPYFIQNNNGTGIQRYYESGCQRYGYFIRCVKEPEAQVGIVQTKEATDVKWNAATLNGYIVSDGYTSVTERGFFWNTTGAPTSEDNKVVAEGSSYTYSYNMTDLTPETKYYVKAYMINTEGMSLGEDVEFTTLPKPAVATVTTGEAYNIMLTSVAIDGTVTADGGAEVTERGICYATTAEPTIEATVVKSGKGVGSFTVELSALVPGTAYFARAYAVNEIGVAYGNEVTFSPLAEANKPTVLTKSVTNILDVSATVYGEITANGGDDVTASGVCYSSENKMPEITDQVQTATATMGTFSVNLSGLTPDKTYYVRAYAQNAAGVAYGDTISFTTLAEILEMSVDAGEVTDVTRTNATVSATLKYGVDVTERGFIYGLYKNITHKSHPTVVLLGSQVVEGTDNGEFSYTFTNFIQGGMYYVRGYAKTSTGEYAYSPDMKVVMQDPDGLKDCGTVTDPDGNVYRTVQLGGQCWMRENLHTTKYSDGSDISLFLPVGTTKKVSQTITEYVPSVVTYSGYGDTLTGDNAGYFYGYGLRSDPKANMLCPSGWHVSSGEDWNNLFNYVNETYCEGSLTLKPYASNTKTIQVVNNQNLYYPLVLPHYFGSNGFKNTNENTNATGFGWFYFGDLNGNTSSSYYRTSQTYYEAMWTSSPVTTTTTATMNSFVQHNATYMQYVNETGNVGYGMMLRCVKD